MTTTTPAARTTNELIKQMPDGAVPFSVMLKKLGLWTNRSHDSIDERRPFARNLSTLGPDQLADENAYWSSEAGRIHELHGFLQAQKIQTDLETKVAAATARNAVRRRLDSQNKGKDKPVKMTTGEVNDHAELETVLKEAREKAVLVESTLASVAASKEATLLYLNSLSREITRRGDLMKARL